MDLDVVFLGTSGSAPTALRAPAATLIRRGGDRLLFDCAEGTQRQLLRSQIGLVDLHEIFLTHYHADHYLGLPGMLKTFALRGREAPITIYGPPGLREPVRRAAPDLRAAHVPLRARGARAGDTLARDEYRIAVVRRRPHARVASATRFARRRGPGGSTSRPPTGSASRRDRERGQLQRGEAVRLDDGRVILPEHVLGPPRAGRTVVLTGDTAPAATVWRPRTEPTCWCTRPPSARRRPSARERRSTPRPRRLPRRRASRGVRLLALTHLSTRYGRRVIKEEAREVFPETVVPRDFDVVEVPFPERGAPQLVKAGAAAERIPETLPVELQVP